MPTPEQILEGLNRISSQWTALAVIWHAYFGILLILLLAGVRRAQRVMAVVLSLPLLSVSALAWDASNPFNGTMFLLFGIGLIVIGLRLPAEPVTVSRQWLVTGLLVILFGWIYPHFISEDPALHYLITAPLGLVPCPTLSMVIGISFLLGGLSSPGWMRILGSAGILYGLFGAFRLGVYIDIILLVAAVLLVAASTRVLGAASLHPDAARRS